MAEIKGIGKVYRGEQELGQVMYSLMEEWTPAGKQRPVTGSLFPFGSPIDLEFAYESNEILRLKLQTGEDLFFCVMSTVLTGPWKIKQVSSSR